MQEIEIGDIIFHSGVTSGQQRLRVCGLDGDYVGLESISDMIIQESHPLYCGKHLLSGIIRCFALTKKDFISAKLLVSNACSHEDRFVAFMANENSTKYFDSLVDELWSKVVGAATKHLGDDLAVVCNDFDFVRKLGYSFSGSLPVEFDMGAISSMWGMEFVCNNDPENPILFEVVSTKSQAYADLKKNAAEGKDAH